MVEHERAQTKLFNQRISRRDVLLGGASGFFGALFAGKEVENYIFGEQNAIWYEAGKENDEFLVDNSDKLSHIKYGASFAPEMFDELSLKMMGESPFWFEKNQERMLQALDVVIGEFGIKDIRLGARWNNSVVNNQTNLAFYDPVIRKCLDNNVNITFNCGAIKTFRWPEDHVPHEILSSISLPPKDGKVEGNDELAKHALDFLEGLFEKLQTEYGPSAQKNFVGIQPENEGFHRFGKNKWIMSKGYYKSVINLSHEYFPNATILLNSAGGNNLDEIREVFFEIEDENPDLMHKLEAGIDFYFDTPHTMHLWGVHPSVDPITLSTIQNLRGKNDFDRHKKIAQARGIKTEITEGQSERYNEIVLPQESAQAFRFWTLRTAPYTDGMERIWGIEEFAKRFMDGTLTDENKKVLELVKTIQARNNTFD